MLDRALEEMQKKDSKIVDKLSFKEQMAYVLLKVGRFEEAEKTYRSMLFMNPDNYKCFIAIQKCLGLYSENGQYSTDDVDRLCTFYSSLKKEYGWSSVVKVNYLKLFLFFLCSFMLNCWVLRAHNSILIYVVFIRSILQH
ncbi:hypothetical protein DAI22_07g044750 [Oryza sativa Japonica Group]|nr:hypothetical protein DAI22_07g044750 [Oryza sativa Japonica Group]